MKHTLEITLFILIIYILFPNILAADSIHFYTGEDRDIDQTWFGEILSIDADSIRVRFSHDKSSSIHSIHISRILSIYFNHNYEHTFPIRLRKIIEEPMSSNMIRLRKVYLFRHNSNIQEEFPEIYVYGPDGNRLIRANIKSFNKDNRTMEIRARTIDQEENEMEFSGWELSDYIRGWVR